MSADFLVELGTEELPPKALKTLMEAFAQGIQEGLAAEDLGFDDIQAYAAPRRLAVLVQGLAATTPVREVTQWGPPVSVAFDAEGNPGKAALAFAQKNGLDPAELKTASDGKQEKLVHTSQEGGVACTALLAAIVSKSLDSLPIPKRMRWGASRTEFVRPAQWLVMLYGAEVVAGDVLGLSAGRDTRGHRFHHNTTLTLDSAADYARTLETEGKVIADFAERQRRIRDQVEATDSQTGGRVVIDEELLEEVTALVEWPQALVGRFEERFLNVPAEALVSTMAENQKYFHVVDNHDKLLPYFVTVANIESRDPAQVIDGNERVIRPRLSDAAFFFDTDKKTPLTRQRDRLKNIVFQTKLGTVFNKTERIAALAGDMAAQTGANTAHAQRAGQLSKADLVTEMVLEFDKMQGIAGYYYATHDGENPEVAQALTEQYLPKFAGDKLPQTATGTLVALADRLDTIVGIFGIGLKPTGSKDPFALRRASLGALRLLVEKHLDLDLRELLQAAASAHGANIADPAATVDTALAYMLERFRAWYEEAGIATEIYLAVAAKQLTHPGDIDARVRAVNTFAAMPEAAALAAANKRVSNILGKLDSPPTGKPDPALMTEDAEQALAQAVASKADEVAPLFAERQYTEALTALASLREPVDRFFDDVMVMADDDAIRQNRLALLQQLRGLFLQVADISLLVPAKG